MPRYKMPCHATLRHVTPCHITPRHIRPCHVTPRQIKTYHVTLRHAEPCHTTPCHAMPRTAMPCPVTPSTVICNFLRSYLGQFMLHQSSCPSMLIPTSSSTPIYVSSSTPICGPVFLIMYANEKRNKIKRKIKIRGNEQKFVNKRELESERALRNQKHTFFLEIY